MSAPPEILEPIGRKLRVSHRMLNILVPEICLQRPGIVALVGEGEPAGMSEHVWVRQEAEPGGLTGALLQAWQNPL